jgi:lysyl-tRNA synthetase class 2
MMLPEILQRQAAVHGNLNTRANVMSAVRSFFSSEGYLEVDTPIRIPEPAPETHIDPQASGGWVLQTSPELCMKRLLASGYKRIFQICKCFRKAERGHRHLPEMTMLEWYTADASYEHMMAQCEAMVLSVAAAIGHAPTIIFREQKIDLKPPWPRLTVSRAFEQYADMSMQEALATDRFDKIMALNIEPRLGRRQPVFLCDYPVACGALARRKPSHPDVVERFELYIGGLELCNAFGELTDPEEQRRRFEDANAQRRALEKKAYNLPEPFLSALGHMPAAAGNALGIDRLVMLLTDSESIDEVVAFTPEEL